MLRDNVPGSSAVADVGQLACDMGGFIVADAVQDQSGQQWPIKAWLTSQSRRSSRIGVKITAVKVS